MAAHAPTDADFDEWEKDAEVASRKHDLDRLRDVLALLFAAQLDFVTDPAKRKTLLCARGCGKTFVAAVYMYAVALSKPRALCWFIAIDGKTAKKIIWSTLLDLNQRFDLGFKANETLATLTGANGSIIELGGCETRSDIEKYRGRSPDLVIIDEAKSFPVLLLTELVQEGIEPRLADHQGTLCLLGTPGYIFAGLFFLATHQTKSIKIGEPDKKGKRRAMSRPFRLRDDETWTGFVEMRSNPDADTTFTWSSHAWRQWENTALPHLWDEHLATKAANDWSDDNPKWLREYEGLWAIDDSEYCVTYDPEKNGWTPGDATDGGGDFGTPDEKGHLPNPLGLPVAPGREWRFGLGSDLGHDTFFTIQVFAWANDMLDFFQVYEFELQKGHPSAWAAAYRKALADVGGDITFWVVDQGGLGKAINEEFAIIHRIHLEAADKHQKLAHIRIWDGELIDGRCKIMRGSQLERQVLTVAWEDKTKTELAEGVDHDHFHAALYIVRKLQHHFAELRGPNDPEPGSREYELARQEARAEAVDKKRVRGERPDMVGEDAPLDAEPFWN